MQVRFGGSHRKATNHGNGGNGGHANATGASTGLTLLYKRLRSRASWPRQWHWSELSKRQRQLVLATAGVAVLGAIIALWPARGFEAYGVVTAQELSISADADLTVTDCYVRVGDRVKAGDPLFVTVNGDPSATLAELGERLDSMRLRLLSLEASEPSAAPELADEAERRAEAVAALAATTDALAAMPEAPDLSAIDLDLGTADAAVDNAMAAHRRSQIQLGEIERLRALDAAPIGDLRSAEDREGARYRALQEALLRKRSLEAERGSLIAEHALARSALADRLRREQENLAAIEQRLLRQRDRLVADLGDEISRIKAERERVVEAHEPDTHLASASCVVREVAVADGTTLIAGAPIMRLDLDDRLQVQAYVPGSRRSELSTIKHAWIYPDDDGRIDGAIATRAKVALPVPEAVRQRVDFDDTKALLVVIEPEGEGELVPGEVVRLRVW